MNQAPVYKPLPLTPPTIRLLTLHSSPNPLSPLICTTTPYPLSSPTRPPYTSLSYTWGPISPAVLITLNAHSFPITPNLAAALVQLREADREVVLWVDALCINQQDVEEKSAQIGLMRGIYRTGRETVCWLGTEGEDGGLAMECVAQVAREWEGKGEIDLRGKELLAVRGALGRAWWGRIWVVQAFISLDDARRGYHRPTLSRRAPLSLLARNPFSALLNSYTADRTAILAATSSLAEWLTTTPDFRATDPRDQVFGLLGLVGEANPHNAKIVPDYTKSVAQVYAEAAVYAIVSTQTLHMLQFDQDAKSAEHDLPSWVPNFDFEEGRRRYVNMRHEASLIGVFRGSSRLRTQSLTAHGWRTLRIRGVRIDTVAVAMGNPYMPAYEGTDPAARLANVSARAEQTRSNVRHWESVWREWEECHYGSEEERKEEAFWRTLMGNCTVAYEDAPLGPRNEGFEAWMGRSEVPGELWSREENQKLEKEEVERLFMKPFTDAAITKCHGRAFVVTRKGCCGLAPFKTTVGDAVFLLEGGGVPYFLRPKDQGRFEFMGEGYVHGIMGGEFSDNVEEENIEDVMLE